jgi:hypothetical protein
MNEQPGDLLDEAVKLFETLRRRWDETGGEPGRAGERPSRARGPASGDDENDGDVWSRAVAEVEAAGPKDAREEPPRIATGAPECRDCPICRAIAVARESGDDVREHVREAGRSLLAAAMDVAAAFERTRGPRGPGAGPPDGPGGPVDIG